MAMANNAPVKALLGVYALRRSRAVRALPTACWPDWRRACRPHLHKFLVASSKDGDHELEMVNAMVAFFATAVECLRASRRGGDRIGSGLAAHLRLDLCGDDA